MLFPRRHHNARKSQTSFPRWVEWTHRLGPVIAVITTAIIFVLGLKYTFDPVNKRLWLEDQNAKQQLELDKKETQLREINGRIATAEGALLESAGRLQSTEEHLRETGAALIKKEGQLEQQAALLEANRQALAKNEVLLEQSRAMLAAHQSRLIEVQAEFARQSAELRAVRTQSAATYKYVQQLTLTNFRTYVFYCDLAKDRRNLSEIDATTYSGFDRFDQAHLERLFSCMRDEATKKELVQPLNDADREKLKASIESAISKQAEFFSALLAKAAEFRKENALKRKAIETKFAALMEAAGNDKAQHDALSRRKNVELITADSLTDVYQFIREFTEISTQFLNTVRLDH